MEQKTNVEGISVVTSIALTLGKLVAGLSINSAAVFASGVHSGLDLLASVLSYSSVSQSRKPADEDHRYGHGKYENLAAIAEVFFILIAVLVIIYKAVPGFSSSVVDIARSDVAVAVMGVSCLVSFFVSSMLSGAHRKTASEELLADRRHLLVNACTSAVICIGMLAIRYTGITIIDSLLAILAALVLLFEGYTHVKRSAGGIVDIKLTEEEEGIIREVLARYGEEYVQYHALRTRRSGPDRHVDLHLVVPRDQVIAKTHQICDHIERDINHRLPGVNVLIHAEPCRPFSGECICCGVEKSLQKNEIQCSAKPHSEED
ncbi:MAG: cation diffusion facilitator family transporter [Bacillota bacterium]